MSLQDTKPLIGRVQEVGGLVSLSDYESGGGYAAAKKALTQMTPTEVIDLVREANLRGRGGAGFPTGVKWGFAKGEPQTPGYKYLVCNGDEMEPGTFKDRYLIEFNPHSLIEGMILGSYAIGAEKAYVFLRGEYHEPNRQLVRAIGEAREKNYLGKSIFGSDFNLDLRIHLSGGRYICGEETALLNALEGKRGQPRYKPPFPPASGAWGRPTIVNNVETLCNVPAIVRNGAQWYQDLGLTEDSGTKIYGISGRVKQPGLWELPMGTPIRELVDVHAGGMQKGYKLRGILPGGASTDYLVEEHFDLPMDYKTIQEAGSRMGTGTMILMDDSICPVDMARNLQHFFAQESCGFCTPCREGLPWVEDLLADIENGKGEPGDLELLEQNAQYIGAPGNTFCLHATGAIEPLQSALKYFREDFEHHIEHKNCPYRAY
ncbi:MAG: NADH-quinone oxidoreductase subunit NuoF [Gammaproteobacteria bacterium]|nr:NADH-quinone oxidoreductase subunit NuoF [Gammaproteobacteria bacterium]MYF37706.1 NADH-quinone oxidoreductase subunit NuoF [Gammaproteobacteria bacterium]